ncbi:Gfo/Idh/MocA family protein [Methylomicrobium sp. RS1]|uniref:Gfo/Idh/MocA family protein n=1 Tax=Candidatus Methylomicrobium oryzae TaxID=2802053 RepID=UPI001920E530|nr:Gfo/Idh/MocA family oxidoreductase [Methylomicrobium sp. RS1]MBL1266010.1 Gfo/Idh/MocA family oxidoreductase [Methylomicrobium sp. RS1]
MATHPRIRLALIGLGNQGQEHLKAVNLCSEVELVAGVDLDKRKLEEISSRYSELNFALHDEIGALQQYQLDGLILALPHHCYLDSWDAILSLGLPLLKEKPLGRSLEEARALLDKARTFGYPLQTAIQRRHHPSYQALKKLIFEQQATVSEIHAHLHLGFNPQVENMSWRSQQSMAGGGVLLDSGYHLVDLVHYLVGPFDLVAASLWRNGHALNAQEIEDEAYLMGRSEQTWVMIESLLAGKPDGVSSSGFKKSEGVSLLTNKGLFFADRQGLYRDGVLIESHVKEWNIAMAIQLDNFARNIRFGQWSSLSIWDQLPAMQLIEHAYKSALHY